MRTRARRSVVDHSLGMGEAPRPPRAQTRRCRVPPQAASRIPLSGTRRRTRRACSPRARCGRRRPSRVRRDRVKERYRSNIDHLHEQLADQYNGAKADLETVQVIKSGPSLKKRIQKFIDEADQIISIIVPPVLLAELTDALAAAVDRDVFVLLVTYGNLKEQLAVDAFDLDEIAHVTRTQQTEVPIQLAVDGSFGLLAPRSLLTNPSEQTKAVAFGQSYIEPGPSARSSVAPIAPRVAPTQ